MPRLAWLIFACLLSLPLFGSQDAPDAAVPAEPAAVASFTAFGSPAPVLAAVAAPNAGEEFSRFVTQITGVAMSPLLGLGAVGAWEYFRTEDSANLAWYAKPVFWMSALFLVVLVAAKDVLGAAIPAGWKKPLDIADTLENKLTGLLATGAFVPIAVDQISKFLAGGGGQSAQVLTGADGSTIAAIDWSPFLTVAMVPLTAAVFLAVWLLSHAINVLILISPFGPVDAALKAARTSVMGGLAAVSAFNPWLAAICSGVIIIVALLLAGWAFRLTVFGTVFSWDFLTFRTFRNSVEPRSNRAFAGRKLPSVPNRSLGRLEIAEDGAVVFRWRPWLVLPARTVALPTGDTVVGKGLFHPILTRVEGALEKPSHLISFPPRHRGHEEELMRVYRAREVREVGLMRGWALMKELIGLGSRPAATAQT